MLTEMWSKWNSHTLLVGWSINCFNYFGKLVVSMNLNTHAPSNPEILLLGLYPSKISAYVYKKIHKNIHCIFTHKSPKRENYFYPSIKD